jgi:hypothetical protein
MNFDVPNSARIYDYWLGGSHNFPIDREVGQRLADALPGAVEWVRAQRSFLRRVVTHLVAERGVTQFIDLGSGLPTAGNTHQIAHRINRDVRVVYVDADPVVIAHASHILRDVPGVSEILVDVSDVDAVWENTETRRLIDVDEPVGLLAIGILHVLPDTQDPTGLMRRYIDRLAPGSFVTVSHATNWPDAPPTFQSALAHYYEQVASRLVPRSVEQITDMVAGLEIEPPGVVSLGEWQPDDELTPSGGVVALARKASR